MTIVRAEIECQPAVAADKKTKDDVAETRGEGKEEANILDRRWFSP